MYKIDVYVGGWGRGEGVQKLTYTWFVGKEEFAELGGLKD